jgi:predicted Rossmann fold nucleotide-binding protein DprA/Smf involved in DNA uptake
MLSPGEYKRLARHLREMQRKPADLVTLDAADLLRACQPVIDEGRLTRLLARGFLLSQVIERWQARAIWVVSRADADYPRRLKARLREDAPAVLYGCGDISLLETGGLAVVGSRHVGEELIEYTMAVGRLAARAGRTVVSGGAKGIDQAAMRGALEAGGRVSGVLADSLEKTTMNREHRNLLLDGQLVLISPYDPSAGFNVGNAMQRNKLIYALADASLVVSSDMNKGGTWTGAVEQLDKLRFVPVYVRLTGESSPGLDALRSKGAKPWPNPGDADALDAVFEVMPAEAPARPQTGTFIFDHEPSAQTTQIGSQLDSEPSEPVPHQTAGDVAMSPTERHETGAASDVPPAPDRHEVSVSSDAVTANAPDSSPRLPADALFKVVRTLMHELLRTPKKDSEVAAALNVSASQAKAWLERLVNEGVLEKQKKPAGYVVKQSGLFE